MRVVVMLAALGLAASDAALLEARPPVMRFEVEDNNTPAAATPLGMSGSYGSATGAIGAAGDVDYWSFPSSWDVYVSVLCDTGGVQNAGATSRRVLLSLIGPDGQTEEVDSGDGTGSGGDGTIETSDAAAIGPRSMQVGGLIYIRISAVSETDVVGPYRLLVAMTPVARMELETNDDVQSATAIAVSSGIGVRAGVIDAPGDIDHYSVRATAGDVLFLAAGSRSDPTNMPWNFIGPDVVVDVLAPDGVTELLSLDAASVGSEDDLSTESANFSIPTSGLYFLRVHNPSGAGGRTYLLMAAVRPFSDAAADLDGDFRTDFAVYSSQGQWSFIRSSEPGWPTTKVSWGDPSLDDIPLPADYDGDGLANIAVYRNTTGQWIIRAASGASTVIDWGAPWLDDIPIPGDYDGDRKYDVAVYRKSTGDWFIRFAAGGGAWFQWGAPWLDDLPVHADYDGDGATDVAVYRNATGQWFLAFSGGGAAVVDWGAPWLGDVPVPADYDGDGSADVAVYRKSTGVWYIQYAAGGAAWFQWGGWLDDIPVPGDYEGDGRADVALYRPSTGETFARLSNGDVRASQFPPNQVPVNRPVAVR